MEIRFGQEKINLQKQMEFKLLFKIILQGTNNTDDLDNQCPHFNIRPIENIRTGTVPVDFIIINFKGINMYWNELDGSFLLNKVFSNPVKINEIDIFDITIDREGATVIITFDLIDELPDNPLPKWIKGYNRCRCGINCGCVSAIKIEGISTNMPAKIKIDKNDHYNEVSINGSTIYLYLKCAHIQFMGPSVYISN